MQARNYSTFVLLSLPVICLGLFLLLQAQIEHIRVVQESQRVDQLQTKLVDDLPTATVRPAHCTTPLGPTLRVHDFALLSAPSRIVVIGTTGKKPDDYPKLRVVESESGRTLFESREERGDCSLVVVSPDGKVFAVAGDFRESDTGYVRVYEAITYKVLWEGRIKYGSRTLAWSDDGTQLAAGNQFDGTVTIWDRDGKNQREAWRPSDGESGTVTQQVWSHDGKRIASCSSDNLHVWSVADGCESVVFKGDPLLRGFAKNGRNEARIERELNGIGTFQFTPDDRSILLSTARTRNEAESCQQIWIWDLESNRNRLNLFTTRNGIIFLQSHRSNKEILQVASIVTERVKRPSQRVLLEWRKLEDGQRIRAVMFETEHARHWRGTRVSPDFRTLEVAESVGDEERAITTYEIPQLP